ncbi:MAG: hypothetical protein ACKOBG_07840 [Actinomycetota bacterium]
MTLTGGVERQFLVRWNGTAWTLVTPPLPVGTTESGLYGVTCASTASCWSVGRVKISGTWRRLLLRWNGTAWATATSPLPIGTTDSALFGVVCTATDNCWTVGRATASGVTRRMVLRWNGTVWSAVLTPALPTGTTSSELYGVACASTASCWAVGKRLVNANLTELPLVLRWNGSAWSNATTPLPGDAIGGYLTGVTCAGPADCWAVGLDNLYSGPRRSMLRWNGTAWSIVNTTLPLGTSSSVLADVTCFASTSCWAVGTVLVSGSWRRLVQRWNGTAWSNVSTPLPVNTTASRLSGIGCVTSTNCWTVGRTTDTGGNELRLVIHLT